MPQVYEFSATIYMNITAETEEEAFEAAGEYVRAHPGDAYLELTSISEESPEFRGVPL